MILADTNVIINLINKPTEKDLSIITNETIATCGVVEAELYRGIHSERETDKIDEIVKGLTYLKFEESDWIELADLLKKLQKAGIKVPFQDGIIAWLAIKNSCTIWTQDKHFALIKRVFDNLDLLEIA